MNTLKDYPPKKRVLDFSECQYYEEIHQLIRQELELPEWYGRNLDALWDSLTGIMYLPAEITIIYHPKNKNAGAAEEIGKIIEVFREAAAEYDEISLDLQIG